MTKIFISHSSKDNEFAQQLAQALIGVGIDVWLDLADIPASMKWSTAVQQGLDECDVMVLIITPEAMASVNVEDEWQYYFDKQKKVFPIRWKPADVHFQLRRIQYVDFHEKEFAGAFEKLRAELVRNGITVGGADGQVGDIDSDLALYLDTVRKQRSFRMVRASDDFAETLEAAIRDATPSVYIRGEQTGLPRVEDILPPPFEWCEIPAGKVTLEAGGYLKEQTTFDVPAFAIAKYPITNAQFAKFIEAGGYNEKRWWSDADWQRKTQGGWTEPRYWRDEKWNGAGYPVVGVSWYEAIAFCRWLNEAAEAHSRASLQVTLPTEQQWQRAAQGDDGHTYPWGNGFDKAKCNTRESGIDHTTPVTQFPQGASLYGVMDMSGNVSEWNVTELETERIFPHGDGARPLRGGSWYDFHHDARLPYVNWADPLVGSFNRGFRVCVWSPST